MTNLTENESKIVLIANMISIERGIVPICQSKYKIKSDVDAIEERSRPEWIDLQKAYERTRKEIVKKINRSDTVSRDITQATVRLYIIREACARLKIDHEPFKHLYKKF